MRTLGAGKQKALTRKKSKKQAKLVHDTDDDEQATPQPSLLSRKNQLSDLFSSQENFTKNSAPKKRHTFEEDGEFVYKRSQSPTQQSRKKRKVNTPVTQLHEEIDLMAREDIDSDSSDDIFNLSRKKNKQRVKGQSVKNPTKLRSPLGNGYNSDDYIEQVSRETLQLHDNEKAVSNKRRQSYLNRGKRVSSIGNGFVGVPHKEVPVSDYYKLLDTTMPGPDRLRQLLIWNMKKQFEKDEEDLKQRESEDQTAPSIARVIKEEIIRDLTEKKISTSWYDNRNNNIETISGKVVTVPNPLNITNLKNIDIYTKKLKNLRKQKAEWHKVYKQAIRPLETMKISLSDDKKQLNKYIKEERVGNIQPDAIDNSMVETIEANHTEVKSNITKLEPKVDKLYFTAFQLNRASDLLKSVEQQQLNKKVSQYLQGYSNKSKVEAYKSLPSSSGSNNRWSIPLKNVDTKDLLRAICRLETQNKSS